MIKKYIQELSMMASASLIGVAVVFRLFFPEKPLMCFVSIPVFFFFAGLLYIYVVSFCRQTFSADKQVNCFLACKVMKFILSALFVAVYALLVGKEVVAFMIAFMILFLAFLIFETRFFLLYEAKLKHKTIEL